MRSDTLHHLGDLLADLEDTDAVDDVKLTDVHDRSGRIHLSVTFADVAYERSGSAKVDEDDNKSNGGCLCPACRDRDVDETAANQEADVEDAVVEVDETEAPSEDADETATAGEREFIHNEFHVPEQATVHLPDPDNPSEGACWYVDEDEAQFSTADELLERLGQAPDICSVCRDQRDVPEWAATAFEDEAEDETDPDDAGAEDDTTGTESEPTSVVERVAEGEEEGQEDAEEVSAAGHDGGNRDSAAASTSEDDEDDRYWCGRCGQGPFIKPKSVHKHNSRDHDSDLPVTVTHEPSEDELWGEPDGEDRDLRDADELEAAVEETESDARPDGGATARPQTDGTEAEVVDTTVNGADYERDISEWSDLPFAGEIPDHVTPTALENAVEISTSLHEVCDVLGWDDRSKVRSLCYNEDLYTDLKMPEARRDPDGDVDVQDAPDAESAPDPEPEEEPEPELPEPDEDSWSRWS